MKASIYSVLFTLARGHNRSRAADSSKIATFLGIPTFDALVRRPLQTYGVATRHNRFSKTETSFGFKFQCANGLHKTSFYANTQWGVSPHDIV